MWLWLLLAGCDRDSLYAEETLYEDIREVFRDCNPNEISFLCRQYNIQTAFSNCGSNYFSHFSWSPVGDLLYFQLFKGSYILNGETTAVDPIPVAAPTHGSAWIHPSLLVIPLEAKEGEEGSRIAWFNLGGLLEYTAIPLKDPRDLQVSGNQNGFLFTAENELGKRSAYSLSPADTAPQPVFPFAGEIDQFSYSPKTKQLAVVYKNELNLYDEAGQSMMKLPDINRAVLHPEGGYLALEVTGEPITVIRQDTLTHLTEEEKEREKARQKQKASQLPDWAPKETRPPEIDIIVLETMERWKILHFYAEKFEWYQAKNYYVSFILHGIKGQLINQNVGLVDIHPQLYQIGKGDVPSTMKSLGKVTHTP
jgi:hypothetical protein